MKKHPVHYPILRDLGLNEAEALVYEILLEEGPMPGAKIATASGLGRGNAYNTLGFLKNKGLVEEETGTKKLFRALNPERLRLMAQNQEAAAVAVNRQLEAVLPGLKSRFRLLTAQPTVRLYEGLDGMKELFEETLKEKQTIYALFGTDDIHPELLKWGWSDYVKRRARAGIEAIVVVNGERRVGEYVQRNEAELRTTRYINNPKYPFHGEIDIFGDKVALFAYRTEEMVGMLIESPTLAETLRSTVQLLFDMLPGGEPPKKG